MLKLRHVTDELERLRRYIDAMEDRRSGKAVPVGYRPSVPCERGAVTQGNLGSV